jgi:branched-chain amino acid transport system permease protein
VLILIVVVVGGMGSIPGVILGAIIVTVLPEVLRSVSNYRLLLFALALIALMLVRPQGLWPVRRAGAASYAVPPEEVEQIAGTAAPVPRPAPGTLLLRVRGLVHVFGGVRAVDDVSIDVHAGEIVSIIGPNGAGKTTVFNCITGVIRPVRGEVQLLGSRSLRGLRPHKVVTLGLARTFQGIRLFGALSVAENVLVGRSAHQSKLTFGNGLFGRTTHRDRRETMRWLEFVGLAEKAHLPASDLAYGERRRVEIARALASEPVLLLLDEPSAGTNPSEKRELMRLVRHVRDSGVSVVLIEHDMLLVMGLSDRVVVLDQGKIIAEGRPEQVREDPRVIDAYLGRAEEHESEETIEEVLGWHS